MMGLWLKIKHVIDTFYPEARESAYYKQLQLYGVNEMWTDTWNEELIRLRGLNRKPKEIQNCWVSLILWTLWSIWPRMSKATTKDFQWLQLASLALDRAGGTTSFAIGTAATSGVNKRMAGQVDVYDCREDYSREQDWAIQWQKRLVKQ